MVADCDRRKAWDREYSEVRAYTTSYRADLDRSVDFLLAYLRSRQEPLPEPILDCGCGIGRNALPLARAGHEVIGLDLSDVALERLQEVVVAEGHSSRLSLRQHDLSEPLPLADGSIGTVLDVTAVDNLVEPEERLRYGSEVGRVLRPGGLALVVTFALEDGYYGSWLSASRRGRPQVVQDPHTGIHNQLFTHASLDAVFLPHLQREVMAALVFVDEAAGGEWVRRFLLHLYRRPG
ncbi:MAG: class I SAM-dependent methyltransferase [Acidobacteriota bacterium]